MSERSNHFAVGRRKSAIARVKIVPGNGQIIVNGKPLHEALPRADLQQFASEPLRTANAAGKYSAMCKLSGGGVTGWSGAISLGIARALTKADPTLRPVLKRAGLLSRDPRVKERKKYGLKRARKAPQYTKR